MRWSNQTRIWVLILFFSLFCVTLAHYIWGRPGLIWSFALLFFFNSMLFFTGEKLFRHKFKATQLEGRDPWGICELSERAAHHLRIPTPKIYLIPQPHCQAFSLSRALGGHEIYLTKGLVQLLNKKELEGVLSLQLTHIQFRNTQAYSLVGSLSAFLLYFSLKIDLFLSWLLSKKNHQSVIENQGGRMSWFFCLALSILFKYVFNKTDYLLAEKEAASYSKDPQSLASALWKMDSYSKTLPMRVPLYMTHYFIVNPQHKGPFQHCFETQPPVAQRINNLVGHFPF